MKKILFPIFALILAACATPTPVQVTVTSEVTVTSTATPTLTPTPTITFTPTPQLPPAIIADIQSRLPGYSVAYTAEGAVFQDKDGNILPDITIEPSADGTTWKGVIAPHKFEYTNRQGVKNTYNLDQPTTFKADEFSVTPDGNLLYPAHKWKDGEWVRTTNTYTNSKGEEIDAGNLEYTDQETAQILIEETQRIIEKSKEECKVEGACDRHGIPNRYFDKSKEIIEKLVKITGSSCVYDGVTYVRFRPKNSDGLRAANGIFVITDEKTGEYKAHTTTLYHFVSIGKNGEDTLLSFIDADGNPQIIFVSAEKLNDPDYFKIRYPKVPVPAVGIH